MNHNSTCSTSSNCVWRVSRFLKSRGSNLNPWNLCVGMVDGEPCARRASVAVGRFFDNDGNHHEGHPFCAEHASLIGLSFASNQAVEKLMSKGNRGVAAQFDGTVYYGVGGGKVKIGFSKNAEKRRPQIETASGMRFDSFDWMYGDRSIERQLHGEYAQYRTVGEWFEAHPAVLAGLQDTFSDKRLRPRW